METVNAIRAVRTTMDAGHQDVPYEDVVLVKATVVEGGEENAEDGGAA